MPKLLGIAIPTYNRASSLNLLIQTLHKELAGLENVVDVVVSNNASTDDTGQILAAWQEKWPALICNTNKSNVGAEENFCCALDRLNTQYFWLIGDDDLPKTGLLSKVVALLNNEAPDLVYLNSDWRPEIHGPDDGAMLPPALNIERPDRQHFASTVHAWFTFISGVIVNAHTLARSRQSLSLRVYHGTQLIQLGWVLPVLAAGTRFVYVHDQCVLAKSGNTGGYALLTVFGSNFPKIVNQELRQNPQLASSLIARVVRDYLPGLIWNARFVSAGKFAKEQPWTVMRPQLSRFALFWLLLTPLTISPKLIASQFYNIWRVLMRLQRADRSRASRRSLINAAAS